MNIYLKYLTVILPLSLMIVSCGKKEDPKKDLFSGDWKRSPSGENWIEVAVSYCNWDGLDLSKASFGNDKIFYATVKCINEDSTKCTITGDINGSQDNGVINIKNVSFIRDNDTNTNAETAISTCSAHMPDKGIIPYTKTNQKLTIKTNNAKNLSDNREFR